MRTTISVDNELLAAAKRRARERGVSLGTVIEEALRRSLASEDEPTPPPVPVFRGGDGPRSGVDLTSNRALRELLDEESDPLQRR
ncbi:MAG TPA: ribbon-helix-helix protein, CopG family [Jiangellales bacterium]|nr:ribbon-helix-helix protein, CopG family [Jiangellales bacterium]